MIEYVQRTGTDCEKWDGLAQNFGADGLLALWVADMDFKIDSHILDAMREYLETGVIGYYQVPDSYYQAFINWERTRHNVEVKRAWLRFSPGVVAGFHLAVQVFTEPGDTVMISTPVYYPFIHAAEANNRVLVKAPLRNHAGTYDIDFDKFEHLIVEHQVKAYLLCAPHNPVSRVWTEAELQQILDICRKHNVAIIDDEIHQDLVFDGHNHFSLMRLTTEADRIIMFTAASKTFNIAGVQNAFAVIENPQVREQWDALLGGIRLLEGNALGYIAVRAAYTHGVPWLEEVKNIIWDNYCYLKDRLAEQLPQVVVTPLEGTYLAWLDFAAYLTPDQVQPFMQDTCKLAFDYGNWFGNDSDSTFIRVNLATSRENIDEMLNRIIEYMPTA